MSRSQLIFFDFFSVTHCHRVQANFLVVLLQSSQILASFREFTFFHTFTDIPVDEGTLGIHKIELVVKTGPGFSNSSGVGQHADGTGNPGDITVGDDSRSLVVDTNLETSRAPVDELDGTLGLDRSNSSVTSVANTEKPRELPYIEMLLLN
jgi:hypothetical protein